MTRFNGLLLVVITVLLGIVAGLFLLAPLTPSAVSPVVGYCLVSLLLLAVVAVVALRHRLLKHLVHHPSLEHLHIDVDGLGVIKRLADRCVAQVVAMEQIKQALESQRLQRKEYRSLAAALLNQIGEGAFVLDRCGRVILVNQDAQAMTGYKEDDLINKSLDIALLSKLDMLYLHGWQSELAANKPVWLECPHTDVLTHRHGGHKQCEWMLELLPETAIGTYLLRIAPPRGSGTMRRELLLRGNPDRGIETPTRLNSR